MQHLKAGEFSITLHRNRYLIAFLLILLLSSIYVFVFGESGLLERYMLEGKKNQLLQKNEALKKINRGLRKNYRPMRMAEWKRLILPMPVLCKRAAKFSS